MGKVRQSKEVEFSTKFRPKFWADADKRKHAVRRIQERYEALKVDTGIDSLQKDTLLQRAVFLELQLETMEMEAVQKETFDSNRYVTLLNSFLGLLKALGLKKATKTVEDLESYLEEV